MTGFVHIFDIIWRRRRVNGRLLVFSWVDGRTKIDFCAYVLAFRGIHVMFTHNFEIGGPQID